MDTVTWSLLSGVLQILYIHVVLGSNCHTYKEGCCTHCNPGFYLTQNCGTCVRCPDGGYADKPNDSFMCSLCNRCEVPFMYISRCTSTRDAVCTCIAGKKCTDDKCSQCTSVQCPAGQQRAGERCTNCPPGTFNNGMKLKCTPWKNCSALGGEIIITNGSKLSDVVCGPYVTKVTQSSSSSSSITTTTSITKMGKVVRPPSEESNFQIIYIVVSSSLGLLLIAICVACRKKLTEKIKQACQKIPKPVVKQAEEEDGCSYHYPEEENGGEDEPMTLEA